MDDEKMRILLINGSPNKKRNTATLMSWVAEGAQEAGASIDWVHLTDLDINYCQGCQSCLKTGSCIINDDLQPLLEKVEKADALIVGSPVYEGYPSAQMKTVMDRVSLLNLYAGAHEDKYAIGVATSGIAPTRKTAKTCAITFGRRLDWIGGKTASLDGGYTNISKDSHPKLVSKAKRKGKKLVKYSEKPKLKRSLFYRWINFLRKRFLSRLVRKNKDQFKAVYEIMVDKGWIRE